MLRRNLALPFALCLVALILGTTVLFRRNVVSSVEVKGNFQGAKVSAGGGNIRIVPAPGGKKTSGFRLKGLFKRAPEDANPGGIGGEESAGSGENGEGEKEYAPEIEASRKPDYRFLMYAFIGLGCVLVILAGIFCVFGWPCCPGR